MDVIEQKAPKIWSGKVTLIGREIGVKAVVQEVHITTKFGQEITYVPGIFSFEGQLDKMHQKLYNFIGWEMLVDFGDFKVKCALKDREGHIVSCQAPVTDMTPEELWRFSGGL